MQSGCNDSPKFEENNLEFIVCRKHHDAKSLWGQADCVCLDVDSTLCEDEAVDELSRFLGAGEEVARLTQEAMSGKMTYKESLERSLACIRPSRDDLQNYVKQHPPRLTPGARDLVQLLHDQDVPVYLISGGFRAIIEPAADLLNISHLNIFANRILFDEEGNYSGFDESEPTSVAGGKAKVIADLKVTHNYQRLVHIGDGANDLEASPPADLFIGFGANRVRENVLQGASWYVMSFQELIDERRKPNLQA